MADQDQRGVEGSGSEPKINVTFGRNGEFQTVLIIASEEALERGWLYHKGWAVNMGALFEALAEEADGGQKIGVEDGNDPV